MNTKEKKKEKKRILKREFTMLYYDLWLKKVHDNNKGNTCR